MRNDKLQEYICDYVDGFMSGTMREMFEDYLAQNPEIKEFVRFADKGRKNLQLLSKEVIKYPRYSDVDTN